MSRTEAPEAAKEGRGVGVAILRWLAVLPGASLASWVVALLLWLSSIAYESSGWGDTSPFLDMLGRAALMPAAFVYVGVLVAPRRHVAVALTLASIYSLATAVFTYAVLTSGTYVIMITDEIEVPDWVAVLSVVISVAAAFATVFLLKRQDEV